MLIDGSVYSAWETAIAVHGTVTVGATGSVWGRDTGIQLLGDPSDSRGNILHNCGIISSGDAWTGGVAVWLMGPVNVIDNTGTISGAGGIWGWYPASNESFTLHNSGLISASGGAAIAGASVGPNHVVNTGRIEGDILFGSGNDLYAGRNGVHIGEARLGDGNDVFHGGGGTEKVFA